MLANACAVRFLWCFPAGGAVVVITSFVQCNFKYFELIERVDKSAMMLCLLRRSKAEFFHFLGGRC